VETAFVPEKGVCEAEQNEGKRAFAFLGSREQDKIAARFGDVESSALKRSRVVGKSISLDGRERKPLRRIWGVLARSGQTFVLSRMPIWLRPVAIAPAVQQQPPP
jgi:hypothetical protein